MSIHIESADNLLKRQKLVESTLTKLRMAVNHLTNVIYNERDDEDSLDLLRGGCQIGMAWQLVLILLDELEDKTFPKADVELLRYHLRNVSTNCESMVKTARTDMDEIDLLKLGDIIGFSRQMLYEIITSLQRELPTVDDTKTIDQKIAEAVVVAPKTDVFKDSIIEQKRQFEVIAAIEENR